MPTLSTVTAEYARLPSTEMSTMLEDFLTAPFWIDIENWPVSWAIGGTSWFPFLESIHVIAAALLVGAIATIDLRLIGFAAVRYPLSTLNREILPWYGEHSLSRRQPGSACSSPARPPML